MTATVTRESLTAAQAARHLGVSLATVRRWADAGDLPHWRTPGGQRRFQAHELDAWLARRKERGR